MLKHCSCVIFSKCISDNYRLKQFLVRGYKLLFSVLSYVLLLFFLYSLYQTCIKMDPLGSAIKDSSTSLGLGRGRPRAIVASLLYEPTVTEAKLSHKRPTEPQ